MGYMLYRFMHYITQVFIVVKLKKMEYFTRKCAKLA